MTATNALTVACWVKFVVPDGVAITQNMTILGNRRTLDWAQPHAYRFYYNATSGNIEFSARGTTAINLVVLQRPQVDRWYHLAVVRGADNFTLYLDGRLVSTTTQSIGNSGNTEGLSIGGFPTAERFYGEVQEVAIYQQALGRAQLVTHRFTDVPPSFGSLRGYFKLGYSLSETDNLRNFAVTQPAGTANLTQVGTGLIGFPETDRNGEQSVFDSHKNGGKDAISALGGSFSWDHAILSRPTPGIPFDLRISYGSSTAYSGQPLENGVELYAEDSVMGSGWRHSLQTRLVPGGLFLQSNSNYVGLLMWDGDLETWARGGGGTYTAFHGEYRGEMREVESNSFIEWTTPERLIFKFHHPTNSQAPLIPGRLVQVRDFNGNSMVLNYDEVTGFLTSVNDTGGGTWTFVYNPQNLLTSISGPSANVAEKWTVTFTYDADGRLASKSIAGPPDYPLPVLAGNALGTPGSTNWQFFYTTASPAGLLQRVVDPRGFNDIQVTYDSFGRKATMSDALNRTVSYKYNNPGIRQLTTTRHANLGGTPASPDDRVEVDTFDRRHRPVSEVDPLGFTKSYTYDPAGNVTSMTDARGATSTSTYDARSNVLTKTNALGETTIWTYAHVLSGGTPHNRPTKELRPATEEAPDGWENRFTYDPAGNLLTHSDGKPGETFGTLVTHAYDARGLVTSSVDANGNQTRFSYDPVTGFLRNRTIAFGTPVAATWNIQTTELGLVRSLENPLAQAVTTTFDVNRMPVSVTDAISRTFRKAYDSNGNLVAESDGSGRYTVHRYNGADERDQSTDRDGRSTDFAYNTFGELIQTNSPFAVSEGVSQSLAIVRLFDRSGRLIEERDPAYSAATPALHRTAYEYDRNGNRIAMVDKLGRRWTTSFDALNRVVGERDPEGNVKRTSYDAAGRLLAVVSPNGDPTTHRYDGRGRLTRWRDAEGFEWIYTYDGVGNILDIEDARQGHYVMTYGPRNERLTERNQDGKQWTYTYDLLARLISQTNPIGAGAGPGGGAVVRTLSYDAVGRVEAVEFNTGRINALGYDNNNNVRFVSRSRPGQATTTLQLEYDVLDRLSESRDTFAKTVRYGYDALGRVTEKTYPGGKVLTQSYDRLGRLTSLAFTGVAQPCTFSYDDNSRLIARTYPNGVTQSNAFDTAGRLSGLNYAGTASPPIALGYAYDRNGNKTSGEENGTLPWKAADVTAYNETATYRPDGKLVARNDALSPRDFTYTYDAAGNLTQAAAPGESYALSYDEDNRTTSITWDVGMTSKQVNNRYDALGRRIARTIDGVETRYVLDLGGSMERILCDTNASGAITAWYVHGPDLCFKVASNGDLTCYHADAQGNVLRTTKPDGLVENQYAYSAYGRPLSAMGTMLLNPTDPFRFSGSQGAMFEFPNISNSGLIFMRARYYSADAGVFLATDPQKEIQAAWKPNFFAFAAGNPLKYSDPNGRIAVPVLLAVGIYWGWENIYLKPANKVLNPVEHLAAHYAGVASDRDDAEHIAGYLPFGDTAVGIIHGVRGEGWGDFAQSLPLPGVESYNFLDHVGNILGYTSVGLERDWKRLFGQKESKPQVQSSNVPSRNDLQYFGQYPTGFGSALQQAQTLNAQQVRTPAPPAKPSKKILAKGRDWHDLRNFLDDLGLSTADAARLIKKAKKRPDDSTNPNQNRSVSLKLNGVKYSFKIRIRGWKIQSWEFSPNGSR